MLPASQTEPLAATPPALGDHSSKAPRPTRAASTTSERVGVAALGLIAGLDGIGYSVALASLMFSGKLAGGIGIATGSALLCSAIVAVYIGIRSAVPTNIAHIQDVAVAVLAALFSRLDLSLPTAFAVISLTSIATGALLWLTGRFRLGRVVKYFPQPVLAGFLAGTGWLLFKGGVSVAVGYSPTLSGLTNTTAATFTKLLPALVLAGVLWFAMSKRRYPAVLLAVLLAAIAIFYLWLAVSPETISSAAQDGYLPKSFGNTSLQIPFPTMLSDVEWSRVLSVAPTIATVAMLSLFAMLMNIAALESATGRDVAIDAELRHAGIANLFVSAVGASPGYTGLSISVLGDKSGVRHRGAGVIAGAVIAAGFVFAQQIITHVPTFVSAGFIIFLGVELLGDWAIRTLKRYSPTESITVLVILGFVVFSGFLEATIAGFVVATLLFAYSYARIPTSRSMGSLATLSSTRERDAGDVKFLRDHGATVEVIRLQGYLFFGSTERIMTHVRSRLENPDIAPLRSVILDASQVSGIDAASAGVFDRLLSLSSAHGFQIALSGASSSVRSVLARCGVKTEDGEVRGSDHGFNGHGFDGHSLDGQRRNRRSIDQQSFDGPGLSERSKDGHSLNEQSFGLDQQGFEQQRFDGRSPNRPGTPALITFDRIDTALRFSEDRLLREAPKSTATPSLHNTLCADEPRALFDALVQAMRRTSHPEGDTLLRVGDPGDELLIIETGSIAVVRPNPAGKPVTLREMSMGALVGDVGFSLKQRRTADNIALEPSVILRINHAEITELERTQPAVAALLHRIVSRALAEKVLVANRMTDHLNS
jgi:sulfate permease, SulP family